MLSDWLWAKLASRGAGAAWHPLICHLIDVAAVAHLVWSEVLPRACRQQVAKALGVDEAVAGRWVALLAGGHDVGKACPAFALRDAGAEARLRPLGFEGYGLPAKDAPHGFVTTLTLPDLLATQLDLGPAVGWTLARAIGGHHGTLPTDVDLFESILPGAVGGGRWEEARAELLKRMVRVTEVRRGEVTVEAVAPALALWLAGFVSVVDWIGSDTHYFPFACPDGVLHHVDDQAYAATAQAAARRALSALGWLGWPGPAEPRSFGELFQGKLPRPLQTLVVERAPTIEAPGLVVIEAPMGEGKTEAALYLADYWTAQCGRRGLYFALPTQATSNQLFSRVRRYLGDRCEEGTVNLQLLHGQASLQAEFEALIKRGSVVLTPASVNGEEGYDHAPPEVIAAEWFTYRKRGLLSPFGVGTVDQALLAILQTRHGFVRLFGLTDKVVVLDEVHAYDTYMSVLLERLLQWLGALGTGVVLLSATLPRSRRERLVAAYRQGRRAPGAETRPVEAVEGAAEASRAPDTGAAEARVPANVPYPRLSWATQTGEGAVDFAADPLSQRTVRLAWVSGEVPEPAHWHGIDQPAGVGFELGEKLQRALAAGGCAAVLCNTVRRAQAVFRALRDRKLFASEELTLLHARFRAVDRATREAEMLARFGPKETGAKRPERAVVVATQVLEQSLDVDFDLMVTDLAPADLLLQRAGRLHRHCRDAAERHGLTKPELWVTAPEVAPAGAPRFNPSPPAVYDRFVLLRSWLELAHRDHIVLPNEIEELVEAVYDERDCPAVAPAGVRRVWATWEAELAARRQQDEAKAKAARILPPDWGEAILTDRSKRLEEDDPTLHPTLQALTRLGDPTVEVVVLLAEEAELAGWRGRPDLTRLRALLERAVRLNDRRAVPHLLRQPLPGGWEEQAMLRHHRLVVLDETRRYRGDGYTLTLDEDLGVVIDWN